MSIWSNIGNVEKVGGLRVRLESPGLYTCKILSTRQGVSKGKYEGISNIGTQLEIIEAKPLPGMASDKLLEVGTQVGWGTLLNNSFRWKDARSFIEAASGVDFDTLVDDADGTHAEKSASVADFVYADDGAAVRGNIVQVAVTESYSEKDQKMYYNQRFKHVALADG